jgi:hypothetical protein
VEADGPIPGPHSMLSFASAAMLADKTVVGDVLGQPGDLPGAAGHPVQMQWWKTQPEAWAACRRDLERPDDVAALRRMGRKPARQAGVRRVSGRLRFHLDVLVHDALRGPVAVRLGRARHQDARFALTGLPYRKSVKAAFPAHWHDPLPHTHVALDDALEQGALFCNMLTELRARKPPWPPAPAADGSEGDPKPAV